MIMLTQTPTIQLPMALYHRLERVAEAIGLSLENVVQQSLQGNLPPSLDDIPAEYRAKLQPLLRLKDEDLLAIAKMHTEKQKWQRQEHLLHQQAEQLLSANEREELASLQHEMEHLIYRKSFATALLKWRGASVDFLLTNP